MIRVVWGSLVAAIAMFIIGFIFFGPWASKPGNQERPRRAGARHPAGPEGEPAADRHLHDPQ